MVSRSVFLLFLLTTSPSLAEFPQWARQIDLSEGVVAGKVALSFWPVEDLVTKAALDPENFEVHMVPDSDLEAERIEPAGTWISPPAGKYKYWLESPAGWMSPNSAIFTYRPTPFEGRGRPIMKWVVPAGLVSLSSEIELPSHQSWRLLHTESHNRGSAPGLELSRRIHEPRTAVLMPEGPVIAGIYDHRQQEYLAIGRPASVYRNGHSMVAPAPPAKGASDLVAVLERPHVVDDFSLYDVALTVREPDSDPEGPEVVIPTAERIYAFWYDLDSKYVTLEVDSPSVFLVPQEIALRSGKVDSYRGRLEELPDLSVRLEIPAALDEQRDSSEPWTLNIIDGLSKDQLRTHTLPSDPQQEIKVRNLPNRHLLVALSIPPWRFTERVDLSDAVDREITLSPRAFTVHGTVRQGEDGRAAKLAFTTGSLPTPGQALGAETQTNSNGEYEIVLFRPFMMVYVFPQGGNKGQPFVEILPKYVDADTVLDIELPNNRFLVEVVDETTRQGIAEADVTVINSYLDDGNEQSTVQRVFTGDDGGASLNPLRPGKLTLSARAEGYEFSEVDQEDVTEQDNERTIVLPLTPVGSTRFLKMLLTGGEPASGAEVIAVDSLEDQPVWQGSCNTQGVVEVPRRLDRRLLLVKHPRAGFLVRLWSAPPEVDAVTSWSLPEIASPLEARIHLADREPARWARVALIQQGLLLQGSLLRWLAGDSMADANGFYRATHLPATPIKLVSWMPEATDAAIEALATDIAYPWPSGIEIEAIE